MFCLFADSPMIDARERREIDRNLLDVAHRGREPRLVLQHRGVRLPMRAWALEILESMLPVCEMLDAVEGGAWFEDAMDDQIAKVRVPELTPSAKMLEEMRDKGEGFYQFARRLSHQHQRYFLERRCPPRSSLNWMPAGRNRLPSSDGSRPSHRPISTGFWRITSPRPERSMSVHEVAGLRKNSRSGFAACLFVLDIGAPGAARAPDGHATYRR